MPTEIEAQSFNLNGSDMEIVSLSSPLTLSKVKEISSWRIYFYIFVLIYGSKFKILMPVNLHWINSTFGKLPLNDPVVIYVMVKLSGDLENWELKHLTAAGWGFLVISSVSQLKFEQAHNLLITGSSYLHDYSVIWIHHEQSVKPQT